MNEEQCDPTRHLAVQRLCARVTELEQSKNCLYFTIAVLTVVNFVGFMLLAAHVNHLEEAVKNLEIFISGGAW